MARRALLVVLLALLLAGPAAVVFATRGEDPPAGAGVDVTEVKVPGAPTDIALAQGRAWVPAAGSGKLTMIEGGASPAVKGAYRAPAGALRVASDGIAVWLAGAGGDRLTAVDPLFLGRATQRSIGVGADTVDVAAGRDGVWVSNGAKGTVTRIDPIAGRRVGEPIRTGRFPTALAVGERDVWVVNSGDGTLARIDPREHLVAGARVPVGRDPQDVAIGFGTVWVANRGDGTLSRIEERTGRPQGEVRLGGAPTALAIASDAVIALDAEGGRVVRLDARTRRVTDVVRVGGYPTAIAIGDDPALWTVDARRGIVTRVSRAQ